MRKLFMIVALFLLFPGSVRAANDFTSSFASVYQVSGSGNTHVSHNITVKNNVSYSFLTKYSISLGAEKIDNLSVTVQGKKVSAATSQVDQSTNLSIAIPQPVIGKDQELNLVVSYDTDSVAVRYGKVWEVNIPRLSRANEASSYKRQIIIPDSFGEPTVASPHSTSMTKTEGNELNLEYVGYPNDSITLLFGEKLTYQLDLTYHLTNSSPSTADTELALPPDTEYQHITLGSIDPAPKNIHVDSDGNWLAVYSLKGMEELKVSARVYVEVYPLPKFTYAAPDLSKLVRKSQYWDTNAENIKILSSRLKTPELIYGYVMDNLEYDYSKVGKESKRLGGSAALNNPTQAICTEFTDTFISLARAAEIPSREVNGYAYTSASALKNSEDEDFLHAWPEYYDANRNTWIQVDPTLGKMTSGLDYFTKLDYGHIAFVIHGIESTYPYPAGSYKVKNNEKTVDITLTDEVPSSEADPELTKVKNGYQVANKGNTALYNYSLILPDKSSYKISYLPPYGSMTITPENTESAFSLGRLTNWVKSLLIRFLHLN